MTDKEKCVKRLEEIGYLADELEQERKELSALLIEAMVDKEELIADYIVKKVTVTKYKPTEGQAEELGAMELVPKINMSIIKKLAESGIKIPKEEFTYIKMTREE
jgi:hypothetical protein